ncbi:hypothetical protein WK56_17175 [Burkholderia ubonensis]|uniref:hypothetical protein n=1 Tax=Burkholderia ubonensis TaxID=101571 RepID=UPI00075788A4|nr:hypothetical protein [Burkholderia ubonensis]KVT70426.1 hypothetical protein WK56_17175 [Burkholderia ubonensis]
MHSAIATAYRPMASAIRSASSGSRTARERDLARKQREKRDRARIVGRFAHPGRHFIDDMPQRLFVSIAGVVVGAHRFR